MSEMSNQNSENNGVNKAGLVGEGYSPGRCSLVLQQWPGCHSTNVRTRWSKKVNSAVMECFFRSKSFNDNGKPIRGYRKQMKQEWEKHRVFEITEQRCVIKRELLQKRLALWFGAWKYSEDDRSKKCDSEWKFWGCGRQQNREGNSKNELNNWKDWWWFRWKYKQCGC